MAKPITSKSAPKAKANRPKGTPIESPLTLDKPYPAALVPKLGVLDEQAKKRQAAAARKARAAQRKIEKANGTYVPVKDRPKPPPAERKPRKSRPFDLRVPVTREEYRHKEGV